MKTSSTWASRCCGVSRTPTDGITDYLFNIQEPASHGEGRCGERHARGRRQLATSNAILTENQASPFRTTSPRLMQTTLDSVPVPASKSSEVQMQRVDPAGIRSSRRSVTFRRPGPTRNGYPKRGGQAYANRIVPEARGQAARVLEAGERLSSDQTIAEATGQSQRFSQDLRGIPEMLLT